MKKLISALVGVTSSASLAGVIDFDFNDLEAGAIPGESITLQSQGIDVTFMAPGLQIRSDFDDLFGTGNVLSSFFDVGPVEVVFSQAVQSVSFENIINGRVTSEIDIISGQAFDADGNLVDSFTGDISDRPTLSGPGIVRVVWDDDGVTGFVVDNVAFVVPAPGGIAAATLGLAAFNARRRR